MASAATIEPPIHSPQVCDPVIEPLVSAPAWMITPSEKKARVAVPKTNQKRPRTSALLHLRDSTGPLSSLQITGVDSDQRVNSHIPGTTKSPVAALASETLTSAATRTRGTKDTAWSNLPTTLPDVSRSLPLSE